MSANSLLEYKIFDGAQLGAVATMRDATHGVLTRTNTILARQPTISWIFTGGMFDAPNVQRYRLLDRNSGLDLPANGEWAGHGATLNYANGRLFFLDHDGTDPNATVAIQGAFNVVRDFVVSFPDQPGHYNNARVWRNVMGLLEDGNGIFITGKNGIHALGVDIVSRRFNGARCVRCVYSDGNSSSISRNREGSVVWGYTGDNPALFNWWVLRDGPATPFAFVQGRSTDTGRRGRNSNAPRDVQIVQPAPLGLKFWGSVAAGTAIVGGGLWVAHKKHWI